MPMRTQTPRLWTSTHRTRLEILRGEKVAQRSDIESNAVQYGTYAAVIMNQSLPRRPRTTDRL
jgi:hypothetical protein